LADDNVVRFFALTVFTVRQHIAMQSVVLPTVNPSVRLSHAGTVSSLEACPMTLVSSWLTSPPNSKGSIESGGAE